MANTKNKTTRRKRTKMSTNDKYTKQEKLIARKIADLTSHKNTAQRKINKHAILKNKAENTLQRTQQKIDLLKKQLQGKHGRKKKR